MRIHHRIRDALKHLLNTLVKLEEKFIDNYVIDVTIQQSVLYILKYLFHRGKTRGESCGPTKALFTGCEKSSKNLGCQKQLSLTLDRLKEKFADNFIMIVTVQQNVLYPLKHLFHRYKTRAVSGSPTKGQFTRCENSSQNLGCTKTSTADA